MTTITKAFQDEVANKLNQLFDLVVNQIVQTAEYQILEDNQQNITMRNYDHFDDLVHSCGLPAEDTDINNLFAVKRILEAEVLYFRSIYEKNKNRPKIGNILECIAELATQYYDNDAPIIDNNYRPGNPVYSPVIDIAVTPSIYVPKRKKTTGIGKLHMLNGPALFEGLSRLSIIRSLINNIEIASDINYRQIDMQFHFAGVNRRPLCLLGVEIENNENKKHLMGDFMNSLMLSKFPVVVVPEASLESCLGLLKMTGIIFNIKEIGVHNILKNVAILKVSQFRTIIDQLLNENGIESLGVPGFN